MNKEKVLESINIALMKKWKTASEAANLAKEAATHTESIAKNKYDTFGLESSYLARGQSKRVMELAADIQAYEKLPLLEFNENTPIKLSALVRLVSDDGEERWVFFGPAAGGIKCECEGNEIVVITADAPLGKKLMGKVVGEEIEFYASKAIKSFQIVDVY